MWSKGYLYEMRIEQALWLREGSPVRLTKDDNRNHSDSLRELTEIAVSLS